MDPVDINSLSVSDSSQSGAREPRPSLAIASRYLRDSLAIAAPAGTLARRLSWMLTGAVRSSCKGYAGSASARVKKPLLLLTLTASSMRGV